MGPFIYIAGTECEIGHKSYRKGKRARGPTVYQGRGVNASQQEPEFVIFTIGHVQERVLPKLLISPTY
jgi:hypothetical protein